jgi:hypothetical protein
MSVPVSQPKIYWTKVPTRQYDPNLEHSYIIGRRLLVPASSGNVTDVYTMTFDASLIKFGIHMSAYTDGDSWNLSGSDFAICESIYTKSIPESFVLEIGKTLASGSDLIFDFFNTGSTAKIVWIDYYFIN